MSFEADHPVAVGTCLFEVVFYHELILEHPFGTLFGPQGNYNIHRLQLLFIENFRYVCYIKSCISRIIGGYRCSLHQKNLILLNHRKGDLERFSGDYFLPDIGKGAAENNCHRILTADPCMQQQRKGCYC